MPKNNFTKQNDLNETGAHFLFASVTTLTTNPAYIPGSLCFIEMIRHPPEGPPIARLFWGRQTATCPISRA